MEQATINYEIWEDGVALYGTAKAKLPDISFMTQTISGAGIAGEYEAVISGMTSAMNMSLDFRTITKEVVRLYEPRRHTLHIRAAQQNESSTGKVTVQSKKFVVIASPKKMALGTLAPASPADASGEFSVVYFAQYDDGVKVIEIDPINYICIINGTDFLADVRAALGR